MAPVIKIAFSIPTKVKANCYLFALAPKIGKGGYANRPFKSTPGYKCRNYRKKRIDFKNCQEFIDRVICDNPKHVKFINGSNKRMCNSDLPFGSHMMCAMLATGKNNTDNDFHFLRRVAFDEFINSIDDFAKNTPKKVILQLLTLKCPKYIWIHQRGWSSGGPIIYDAQTKIITNPYTANFNYNRLNYDKICGLFVVQSRKATTYSEQNIPINQK
tara:strand:+ start:327 stop:971 length:645 start_codon:yes stop_codon:yes gene_type:complete